MPEWRKFVLHGFDDGANFHPAANREALEIDEEEVLLWVVRKATLEWHAQHVVAQSHRTPFCLSSGDSRGIDLPMTLSDERKDFSGKVTLQGSNGIELGMSFGESASDVLFGPLVG